MTATEALRRGDLHTAAEELKQQIRDNPRDPALRIFLFQLSAVTGQWERALSQLNLAGQLDPAAEMMVTSYRTAIQCERLRAEVFAGKRSPLVLGEPDPWIAAMIQAQALRAQGEVEAAESLRQQAFEAAPAIGGTIRWRTAGTGNDEQTQTVEFQWLADADLSLGPILEALVNGRYYWVPFQHIEAIRLQPPTDLRDLVWAPVEFTWVGGGTQVGFIPTRYFGSESSPDDAIRLARKTEWQPGKGDTEVALGQRLLATDQAEYSLLDIREVVFRHPAPAEAQPAAEVSPGDRATDVEGQTASGDPHDG